jgi:hypothetical protein
MLTSEGQRVSEAVTNSPFQPVNFGPLLAPKHGGIGLALATLQLGGSSPGPTLLLSPLEGEYLAAGEWVTGMPALAEPGPHGLRGLYLRGGSRASFAMTPGIAGRCILALTSASIGTVMQVTVSVGGETRSAFVGSASSVVYLGPFAHSADVLSLTAGAPAQRTAYLFISDMRFTPAPAGT